MSDASDLARGRVRKGRLDLSGRRVLVTGASSGIGRALALALAERGARPVLVARREERLEEVADRIHREHGERPAVEAGDLLDPAFRDALVGRWSNGDDAVSVLIDCAAFGSNERFLAADPERLLDLVRLGLRVPLELGTRFLASFVARGDGGLLDVSSLAGFAPTPHHATYSATKAALSVLTLATHAEAKGSGVHVVCVCPGLTDTEFFDAGRYRTTSPMYRMSRMPPERVARLALDALERNRPLVVPGALNALWEKILRLLPRSLVARAAARAMNPDRER